MLEYWHVAPCFQTRVSKSPLPNVKTHLLNESIQKIHAKNALQKTQYNEQISGCSNARNFVDHEILISNGQLSKDT